MSQLIAREKASHWYLADGTPYHMVPKKDGSGLRPVTLRDARKVGAYPSVTNVLGVIAKPGLDAWKLEQAILSSLTLPRGNNEPMDVYARRVVEDMDAQVNAAAAIGTAVHHACQEYALTAKKPEDQELLAFWEPWQLWFDANVEEVRQVEQVVLNHEEGYAGTMDLEAKIRGFGWAIVDFKTQAVKRDAKGFPKPNFYETWLLQLAAYGAAIGSTDHRFINVVIDTSRPAPVIAQVWDQSPEGLRVFLAALDVWRFMKDYRPAKAIEPRDGEQRDSRLETRDGETATARNF